MTILKISLILMPIEKPMILKDGLSGQAMPLLLIFEPFTEPPPTQAKILSGGLFLFAFSATESALQGAKVP